jgi:hypothetical protein
VQKQRANKFYNFFVALKNPKLLVQTLNICANTNKNKDLKVSGLRPPTFNNNKIDF